MPSKSAIAVWSVVVGLYCLHAASYGAWIVDDAAISFAYARNLAAGHGPAAQPGVVPVEGFSNALWVLLLALFDAVNAFDPVLTPKLASGAMTAVALVLVWRTVARDGQGPAFAASLACIAAACNPALVIWSMSGLENGMLVFGTVVMFTMTRRVFAEGATRSAAVAAGVVAALLAFVRPDGALWCAAWPVAASSRAGTQRTARPAIVVFLLTAGLLGLLGEGIRYRTFGDVVPNTFHVKQSAGFGGLVAALVVVPSLVVVLRGIGAHIAAWPERRRWTAGYMLAAACALLLAATSGRSLFRSVFGWLDVVAGAVLLLGWSAWRSPGPAMRAAVLCATIAATAYCALPKDWMGEYRFATVFVPFGTLVAFGLAAEWCGPDARRRWITGAIAAALLLPNYCVRWSRFRRQPTVPVTLVAADHAPFERYREVLGGSRSLLTEDVGAPLLYSSLRIHDLGGLCEPILGRTLFRDPARLADHVFDALRPDFVRLSGDIAIRCGLQEDARFRRDYVAVREWTSDRAPGVPLGHFVRKDALHDDVLLRLRSIVPR
ncbi:MAG: hypothetical protein JNK78_12190 [Planctomycetes bacterium]|nr:hypothetical protein [Planctomycetota bacterium]